MAKHWTAAKIGQYNQSLADASMELDRLTGVVRAQAAEVGEQQAVADVCALLSEKGTAELAGLLAAAIRDRALSGPAR